MLGSAIHSPVNHERYGQTDFFQLAGVLGEKVALNHSYQDGNKRTALFAADMFLRMNGYRLQKPRAKENAEFNEELADAHVLVATRQWTVEELGTSYTTLVLRGH